jgi:hypothetical protein
MSKTCDVGTRDEEHGARERAEHHEQDGYRRGICDPILQLATHGHTSIPVRLRIGAFEICRTRLIRLAAVGRQMQAQCSAHTTRGQARPDRLPFVQLQVICERQRLTNP